MPSVDSIALNPRSSVLLASALARIRWRLAIPAAEGAIEVRQIAEATLECDRTDFITVPSGIAQKRRGLLQALFQNVLRKGPPCLLQQPAQVAGRNPETARDRIRTQPRIGRARADLAQNGGASDGAHAALLHKFARVAFGAERQRHQVENVLAVKLRCPPAGHLCNERSAEIAEQQLKRYVIAIELDAGHPIGARQQFPNCSPRDKYARPPHIGSQMKATGIGVVAYDGFSRSKPHIGAALCLIGAAAADQSDDEGIIAVTQKMR